MIKQIIVCRCDMGMRKGKISAQIAHASTMWLADRITNGETVDIDQAGGDKQIHLTDEELAWLGRPSTLVVVRAESKVQLLDALYAAQAAGLNCHLWFEEDLGDEPTCLAIGPHEADQIFPVTGHLKLLQ